MNSPLRTKLEKPITNLLEDNCDLIYDFSQHVMVGYHILILFASMYIALRKSVVNGAFPAV